MVEGSVVLQKSMGFIEEPGVVGEVVLVERSGSLVDMGASEEAVNAMVSVSSSGKTQARKTRGAPRRSTSSGG